MDFLKIIFRSNPTLFYMLMFLLSTPISSQVNSDVNFYPLHVGDTWQYLVEYKYRDAQKDSSYYATSRVQGIDTLNGKAYFVITNSENYSLKHVRVDSNDATVWEFKGEYECMIDSLSMGVGDSFDSECYPIICEGDTVNSLFNEGRRVKTFTPTKILTGGLGQVILYKYGYGLGLIYSETTDITIEASSVNRTLVYAKIDETEYGEFVKTVHPDVAFYPLHVGDYWIYKIDYFDWSSDELDTTYYDTTSVVGLDTLYGKVYYKINGIFGNSNIRIDSSNATVWAYAWEGEEYLIDSLSSSKGDTFGYFKECIQDTILNIFQEEREVKTFRDNTLISIGSRIKEYSYVAGIGKTNISRIEIDVVGAVRKANLVYANIDGIEYGELPQDLNYYPLDIGNYWEYNIYYGTDPIHTEYKGSYWIKVTGDTTLANNKNYKILEKGYFDNPTTDISFERIDSTTSSVYRSNGIVEYKIDSLGCSEGDTIKCSRFDYTFNLETYCTRIDERNIFNREIKVKYLNDNSGIPNIEYELAENIGLIANYTWEGNSHEEYLQYAKIKNVEYGIPVDVKEINNIPTKFSLSQNYPNPFNPSTTIKYSIPVETRRGVLPQNVTLKIYDMLGREVATLINQIQKTGNYEVRFDATTLTSGIYFYKLQSGDFAETKKLLLLK